MGNPYQDLIASVIALVVDDVVRGSPQDRKDARRVIKTPYFDRLCMEGCNLDPDYLREQLAPYLNA
jgi:hypothetical protein